jgi:hypothetical protein
MEQLKQVKPGQLRVDVVEDSGEDCPEQHLVFEHCY